MANDYDDPYGVLNGGGSAWSTGGFAGAAATVGADQSYVVPRLEDSQPTYAIDAMQTVKVAQGEDAYGWLKDLAKTATGYLIAKDAQQNNVTPPQVYAQTAAQVQGRKVQSNANGGGELLLIGLLVIGGAVLLKD